MPRTLLKILDSTAHSPATTQSNSRLLLGPISAKLQIQRTSICNNIQANLLRHYNNKLCNPSSRRWVEVEPQYRAIRNHPVSKAFYSSSRCSRTWCIRYSKLLEEIITVWACTMEARISLVPATTRWHTCIQIQGLCWWPVRISILRIYIARWSLRCKGSNNYCERSKASQTPTIG